MAGKVVAGPFFQLTCPLDAIYACLVCVIVPRLQSGRITVVVVG